MTKPIVETHMPQWDSFKNTNGLRIHFVVDKGKSNTSPSIFDQPSFKITGSGSLIPL
jgi:hypothetical protein